MLNIQNVKVPLNSFYNVDDYWYDGGSGYATGYLQGNFLRFNQLQDRFTAFTGLTTGISFQRSFFETGVPFGNPGFLGGAFKTINSLPQFPILNRGYVSGFSATALGTGHVNPGDNGGIFNDGIFSGGSFFYAKQPIIKSGYSGMGIECAGNPLTFVGSSESSSTFQSWVGGLGYYQSGHTVNVGGFSGCTLEIRFKKYGFWTPSGVDAGAMTREALYVNTIGPYATNGTSVGGYYDFGIARKTGDNSNTLSIVNGNTFMSPAAKAFETEVLSLPTVINPNTWYTLSVVIKPNVYVNPSTLDGFISSGYIAAYYDGVLEAQRYFGSGFNVSISGTQSGQFWGGVTQGTLLYGFQGRTSPATNSTVAFFGGGFSPAMTIGQGLSPNSPFNGIIDEIRGWDYVRNSGQIFTGYNRTINPAVESGLAIYMRM